MTISARPPAQKKVATNVEGTSDLISVGKSKGEQVGPLSSGFLQVSTSESGLSTTAVAAIC